MSERCCLGPLTADYSGANVDDPSPDPADDSTSSPCEGVVQMTVNVAAVSWSSTWHKHDHGEAAIWLERSPVFAGVARRFVGALSRSILNRRREAVELLTSELFANALLHAPPGSGDARVRLSVKIHDNTLRVE